MRARFAPILAAGACALALLAGCGDDEASAPASTAPPAPASAPSPASGAMLAGSGLSVAEVLADTTGGTLAVGAFLVIEPDGSARLCDLLAESFPPQCGGPSIPVTGLPPELVDGLESARGRRWSEGPVQLLGSVRDGVFVNDPAALAAS